MHPALAAAVVALTVGVITVKSPGGFDSDLIARLHGGFGAVRVQVSNLAGIGGLTPWLSGSWAQAIVAGLEKQTGSGKETAQAPVNYEAARSAQARSREAVDQFTGPKPNACHSMIASGQTVENRLQTDLWAKAMTAAKGNIALGSESASAEMRARMDDHNARYCSREDAARDRCEVAAPSMENADLSAASLFVPNEGETLSNEEYAASMRFVDWATRGAPVENLPRGLERTPAGQRYLAEMRRHQALISNAQYSMNRAIAARRPRQ